MKQKSPSFQMYVKQWLGDDKVMLMDYDAKGMHADLMCISWQQEEPGTLPNEETVLRRWLRNPSNKVWKRVWPQIKKAWQISNKNAFKLHSRGLRREFKKQKTYSRLQADRANKRWDSRRGKTDAVAYAPVLPRHDSGNTRAGYALQSSSSTAVKERERESPAVPFEAFLETWNRLRESLPAVSALSQKRKTKIRERWTERPTLDYWASAIQRMARSSFCQGKSERGWIADFDFLIANDTNHLKVMEGKYDDHGSHERKSIFGLSDPQSGTNGHPRTDSGLRKVASPGAVFAGLRNPPDPAADRPAEPARPDPDRESE